MTLENMKIQNENMELQFDDDETERSESLREYHDRLNETYENLYGSQLNEFQNVYPYARTWKRSRLLRLFERFHGDTNDLRQHLEKYQKEKTIEARQAQREIWKKQFAGEFAAVGLNINSPLVLDQLEKHHGNVQKVIEVMEKRREKKERSRPSPQSTTETEVTKSTKTEEKNRQTYEMTAEDLDHLRELRSAGIHGNPMKILSVFHQCQQSIELTQKYLDDERIRRHKNDETRLEKRIVLAQIHDAYLNLNTCSDWPSDIENVYFDGNNMMFVIDRLRQMRLNRANKQAERALAEIAANWNDEMQIPNVQLIFDSTDQLDQIRTIEVQSAQPTYSTTDEMILSIVRRATNERTVVVTADRGLAVLLKREGCLLVKPFQWFAHCLMVLAPELNKSEHNFNDLVTRFANVNI